MQAAGAKSVLGNFADAKFTCAGITSIFSRRDGKFFVDTDGPDGKLADYLMAKFDQRSHTHHAAGTPAPHARRATCRRRPTWSSIRATTIRCGSRVPTCR